jgi:hypothetical protein
MCGWAGSVRRREVKVDMTTVLLPGFCCMLYTDNSMALNSCASTESPHIRGENSQGVCASIHVNKEGKCSMRGRGARAFSLQGQWCWGRPLSSLLSSFSYLGKNQRMKPPGSTIWEKEVKHCSPGM